jgi:hypothetical protein
MPADFLTKLCGYRPDGNPNTSDRSQDHSVDMGRALFERLGVPPDQNEPGDVGTRFEKLVVADLSERLEQLAPHLSVQRSQAILNFEQYAHLQTIQTLSRTRPTLPDALSALNDAASVLPAHHLSSLERSLLQVVAAADEDAARARSLIDAVGNESSLRLDIAVHRPLALSGSVSPLNHLVAGLSLKWSLRTDRLQDPISQAGRMAAVRRGRMPHVAAVTMEPRPSLLNMLARGSGALDCVYHPDLQALAEAIDDVCSTPGQRWNRDEFHRLVDQRRIRDYDELVTYLATL